MKKLSQKIKESRINWGTDKYNPHSPGGYRGQTTPGLGEPELRHGEYEQDVYVMLFRPYDLGMKFGAAASKVIDVFDLKEISGGADKPSSQNDNLGYVDNFQNPTVALDKLSDGQWYLVVFSTDPMKVKQIKSRFSSQV